jgi:hypothetical protein
VRVDLTAPGVELYVTPLDPAAVARGWQYRLRQIEDVVARERLAVAVNATYFATASNSWLQFSGDLARTMQTLISDHVIAYGPWGASFLWFDAELAPHVLRSRSAVEPVLARAKWAVGAHELQLQNGQVVWDGHSTADARTAIGIDEARRLLFLAVGERISPGRVLHMLADLGARDGILLDGGGSSAMEIGQGSTGIPAGVMLGGSRPVATYIGVRALPCRSPVNIAFCDWMGRGVKGRTGETLPVSPQARQHLAKHHLVFAQIDPHEYWLEVGDSQFVFLAGGLLEADVDARISDGVCRC